MLEIAQRVELLEKRMSDHSQLFADIRTDLRRLEARMDAGFEAIEKRFAQVDARFTQIDARFTGIDVRFTGIDSRFGQLDATLTGLRQDMASHFRWTVGIMVTCLASFVAGMGMILAAVVSQ